MTDSLKINIIGTGNLAWNIAEQLRHSSHKVVAVYGRNKTKAQEVAQLNHSTVVSSITDLPADVDLTLVCLTDRIIPEIAPQLKFLKGIIAHTAGSLPLSVLEPAGNRIAVFYPLQTFTYAVKADWTGVWICLESQQTSDLAILRNIASGLSDVNVVLNSEQRQKLHLAAIFTANFTTYLQCIAENILLDSDMTYNAMIPLLKGVCTKISEIGPGNSITGPAVRGDIATINRHLALLSNFPQYQLLYKSMTDMIMDQVSKKSINK